MGDIYFHQDEKTIEMIAGSVARPDIDVVPDAHQVLEDWEEVGLGRGVHDGVLDELEALVDVVQVEPETVEALSELVEILVPVLVENLELDRELLRAGLVHLPVQGVEDVHQAHPHKLVPQVHPEVEVVRSGDDGVDQGQTIRTQLLVVGDQQALEKQRQLIITMSDFTCLNIITFWGLFGYLKISSLHLNLRTSINTCMNYSLSKNIAYFSWLDLADFAMK